MSGIYRAPGDLPCPAGPGVRHEAGRRGHAGARRGHPSGTAGLRHRGAGGTRHRRRCQHDLRARTVRGGGDHRGRGCRYPHHRLHHRGDPGARHVAGAGESRALPRQPAGRAQFTGDHHAGPVQDRHHAGQHPPTRLRRHHVPLRHPQLRGRAPDHPVRARPEHLRGERRRSHPGRELRRLPGALRGATRTPRA